MSDLIKAISKLTAELAQHNTAAGNAYAVRRNMILDARDAGLPLRDIAAAAKSDPKTVELMMRRKFK